MCITQEKRKGAWNKFEIQKNQLIANEGSSKKQILLIESVVLQRQNI